MGKPEQPDKTAKPPVRRGFGLSWIVALLALPLFYFASLGPVVYLVNQHHGNLPVSRVLGTLETIYIPAFVLENRLPLFRDLVGFCREEGRRHKLAAEQRANESTVPIR